jgi:hypothetical protein
MIVDRIYIVMTFEFVILAFTRSESIRNRSRSRNRSRLREVGVGVGVGVTKKINRLSSPDHYDPIMDKAGSITLSHRCCVSPGPGRL